MHSTEGYALWMYVVATSDKKGIVRLTNTICKSGKDYNVAPHCPYDACKGGGKGDCSSCNKWHD